MSRGGNEDAPSEAGPRGGTVVKCVSHQRSLRLGVWGHCPHPASSASSDGAHTGHMGPSPLALVP